MDKEILKQLKYAVIRSEKGTVILRHGYMPLNFRYSVLVPILKGLKDATGSSNYHPIALSSTFSKIVERLILSRYESVFATNSLQFVLSLILQPLCVQLPSRISLLKYRVGPR